MLKFAFPEMEGPPDGYVYVFPDGYRSRNLHRSSWYDDINKHYKDNGYYQPDNWKALAEHQWCLGAPPGFCKHETGEGHHGYFNTRLTAHDYLHGTVVLSQISAEPDPLVEQSVAEERGKKCTACPANLQVSGCIPCLGIANFIVQIKGAKTTSSDQFLNTCAVCKCSNAAQIWVKTEILAKHSDATQLATMRAMPDCWKARQISDYQAGLANSPNALDAST
jgi:hypothetical protein